MTRYYTLMKKVTIRSKEYHIFEKDHHLKIAQVGIAHGEIYLALDSAIELCDRLEELVRCYEEFRPLPRNGTIRSELMEEPDATYRLELNVVDYRQHLIITQSKPRKTRAPSPSITIRDAEVFRYELLEVINGLCRNLPLELVMDLGIPKVVCGARVAVIYSQVRPWPWNLSNQSEALLFEPELIRMILNHETTQEMRDYCELRYPHLMVDFYVNMDDTINQNAPFDDLKIRWVRRGAQFRVNDFRHGSIVLPHEDRWYTA